MDTEDPITLSINVVSVVIRLRTSPVMICLVKCRRHADHTVKHRLADIGNDTFAQPCDQCIPQAGANRQKSCDAKAQQGNTGPEPWYSSTRKLSTTRRTASGSVNEITAGNNQCSNRSPHQHAIRAYKWPKCTQRANIFGLFAFFICARNGRGVRRLVGHVHSVDLRSFHGRTDLQGQVYSCDMAMALAQ